MVKILVTGSKGQLGFELRRSCPETCHFLGCDIEELDITDLGSVQEFLRGERPDLVINAAAYTAVDQAEAERGPAYAINCEGAENLALACRELNSRLLHISTDFVFDGEQGRPYLPSSPVAPLSVYGKSKALGEQRVRDNYPDGSIVVRTSWLYSSHGANFVKTMLRLLTTQPIVQVVEDQIGTPTWAASLARALWTIAATPRVAGIFHWTDAGVASWYDFACAIQEEALELGLLEKRRRIEPIPSTDFPRPALRPPFSVLDTSSSRQTFDLKPIHWRESLRGMLGELKSS